MIGFYLYLINVVYWFLEIGSLVPQAGLRYCCAVQFGPTLLILLPPKCKIDRHMDHALVDVAF